jgi:hypothetical protein
MEEQPLEKSDSAKIQELAKMLAKFTWSIKDRLPIEDRESPPINKRIPLSNELQHYQTNNERLYDIKLSAKKALSIISLQKTDFVPYEVRNNMNYTVENKDVESANLFFQGLHTWMCPYVIQEIWHSDKKLAEHIIRKWDSVAYGGYNHDVWKFYDSLDTGNRKMLISWYNEKMRNKNY